ncbi:hypothetical protein Tco_0727782 [Tanacetum coccineum]|uniref:Uncharacterized protein n=1 Tax=Tanacetum coccineum TaxID=301880 RepID=A0ABQ4YKC3_9ASTR
MRISREGRNNAMDAVVIPENIERLEVDAIQVSDNTNPCVADVGLRGGLGGAAVDVIVVVGLDHDCCGCLESVVRISPDVAKEARLGSGRDLREQYILSKALVIFHLYEHVDGIWSRLMRHASMGRAKVALKKATVTCHFYFLEDEFDGVSQAALAKQSRRDPLVGWWKIEWGRAIYRCGLAAFKVAASDFEKSNFMYGSSSDFLKIEFFKGRRLFDVMYAVHEFLNLKTVRAVTGP